MKALKTIEFFGNLLDVGVFIEELNNLRTLKISISFSEFFKLLIFGKGYQEITPPQLTELMLNSPTAVIFDIRDLAKSEKTRLPHAVSKPFDTLLKETLIDEKHDSLKSKEVVLICDTGKMSRVAGSMIAEEGFTRIYSVKGGMRRWLRWQNLLSFCDQNCPARFSIES